MNFQKEYKMNNLFVRYAVDECPDDKYFFMHIHECCEIFYFAAGKAAYLVEGARYPLEPGSIMIMSPLESHRAKILDKNRYERFVLNFSVSIVDKIDPEHRLLRPFFDRPAGRGNLYMPSEFPGMQPVEIFHKICEEKLDNYERELRTSAYLFFMLERLSEIYIQRGAAEYRPPESLAEQIVAYVNEHIFCELSVPALAKEFLLSVSQFGKIFKQATGAAPWEYITIKRLSAAREKLRAGVKAQDVAESCGFRDYSAFYRAYMKYFGSSPQSDILGR